MTTDSTKHQAIQNMWMEICAFTENITEVSFKKKPEGRVEKTNRREGGSGTLKIYAGQKK